MEIHCNQKRVKDYQDVDRISNLPDEIRCHILSFIPSKSALKMSTLSKQWKHLWTRVPVLDFSELPHSYIDVWELSSHQITHFKNFVRKVLVRNDVPFVRFLNLDLRVFRRYHSHCINSWLDTIAKKIILKIVIIHMHTTNQPQVALPTNFLSREKLVALTLHGKLSIDDKMLVHLPNLEFLHFAFAQFPNDEFLKRLLSGCLVLKDLAIAFCTGINNVLFVESLSLRKLRIWCVASGTEWAGMVIRTPSLRCLDLHDTLKQHVTGDLSSLDAAYLNINYERADYGLQVFQLISGVTKLSLTNSETFQNFRYISEPPVFQNLTCLELDIAEKLCTILGCAFNLKHLIFVKEVYADKSLKSEAVPVCLSTLEVVHFYRFEGKEEEFELVAYFLKFASVLKEMKIYIASIYRKTDYERLLMLPRSSNSCQLIDTSCPVKKKIS